ncbi:MAG: RNA-binding protein [candidate division FCPU426 bacterium]
MAKKLYVGNLPYSFTDQDLQSLFSQAGTVSSAQVIMDRASGRSKGFGFVEMVSDSEAESAIARFHGQENNGRPLTVNEARPMVPREQRSGSGGGNGGFGGGRNRY